MPDLQSVISGEPVTLESIDIGTHLNTGFYSDVTRLYGSTRLTLNARTARAERRGDGGQRLASYTRIVDGQLTFEFSGDLTSLGVMFGITPSISGVTPERIRSFILEDRTLPYIGANGGFTTNTGLRHGLHVFTPKLMLASDTIPMINISGTNEAEFATVSLDFDIITDDWYVTGAANEVQAINLGGASAGNYTLKFGGQTTTALAHDADAATIEAALEALSNIGEGNASVAADSGDDDFLVTFSGNRLGYAKLPLLVITGDGSFNGVSEEVTRSVVGSEGNYLLSGIYEVEAGLTPTLPPSFI